MNFRLITLALALMLVVPMTASAQEERKDPPQRNLIKLPVVRTTTPSGRRKLITPPENIDLAAIQRAQIPRATLDSVAELGSDIFAQREAASESLRISSVSDNVLMSILESDQLDHEQRHRLLRVMRWRVLYKPRGAVGIQMKPGTLGIEITRVIPGLPAEKVLKVGDQIVKVNSTDVRANNDLIGVVQSMLPGTLIEMTIRRPDPDVEGGTEIRVEFPLGSYEKLDNNESSINFSNPETDRRNRMVEWLNFKYSDRLSTLSPGVQGPPFVPIKK